MFEKIYIDDTSINFMQTNKKIFLTLGIFVYTLGAILLLFASPNIHLSPGESSPGPDYFLIASTILLILALILLIGDFIKKDGKKHISKNKKRN